MSILKNMFNNIKNEQWYVKELIAKINNNEIIKPKFQRKRKWDIVPSKNNEHIPNEKSYIEFLYKKKNSVHAITFGQEARLNDVCFSNIDGNNRINAIKHFIENPFDIFSDYLTTLNNILDNNNSENTKEIKNIFSSLSYNQFLSIKRPDKFFRDTIKKSYLFDEIKDIQNDIDDEIDKIKEKLKINGEDNFDTNVKISVNIFEGYTTDDLCETFEEINKYSSNFTETELLSCRLYNVYNFDIFDNVFKTSLENSIIKYYDDKAQNEVLECYKFNPELHNINAHDLIIGFQNLCSVNFDFIEKTDADGLSLYFKLWKALYNNYEENTFNSNNVNKFIDDINYSCILIKETYSIIFTNQINDKLFNNTCQKKFKCLKKNNMFILICFIISHKNNYTHESIIKNYLEKIILYHFLTSDIKDKNKRDEFRNYDGISYTSGGVYIKNLTTKILNTPNIIVDNLTITKFTDLLTFLFNENNNPYERKLPNGNFKNDKRRILKFFEKTIMFYFYKKKMPTNFLEKEFSIEHICPNSSDWIGKLDKDRTGNLVPIISNINSSRGNKHINQYEKTTEGKEFITFIKDIIPSHSNYDNIVIFDRKPTIKNIELYNEMCNKNENIYKDCFIKSLFFI